MKRELCNAFCSQLHVERVPAGWAVQTPYRHPDGDPLMFFIMTVCDGIARLEDDGATLAVLEANGVSMDSKGARYETLLSLLSDHDAYFDGDEGVIRSPDLAIAEVPNAAVKFMALMLRIHDLALLNVDRVRKTWRDDAVADIHRQFDPISTVEENVLVIPGTGSLFADVVIRAVGVAPIAVILATSNGKGLQALVLKMELEKYQHKEATVLLLVERAKENPLAEPTYALAQSRLNGVHTYRGAELDAMSAIGRYLQSSHETVQ